MHYQLLSCGHSDFSADVTLQVSTMRVSDFTAHRLSATTHSGFSHVGFGAIVHPIAQSLSHRTFFPDVSVCFVCVSMQMVFDVLFLMHGTLVLSG
jgi:hypothetical protein